ncbi:hypothetical protein GCM10010339_66390 [Streptomyces alanosinicus]|uniref:Hsp70 family protein n=1 Tax=Streptomyces alanosinicus TaxID=68171 RepID=A0A918YPR5_9ACTN|nr:Hsp70 family protein [Streptomyces alanosinicus]GHE10392.1 hypothetical protein GCM10010339_66390 [Streptomyces alanosinicus]
MDSAQGRIYLARSPRHADVDHLSEMRAAALDPQPWKRIGSLHLVEQLLGSVREPTRDTARASLLGLIADTDREVARRARRLWYERGLGDIPTARASRPAAPHPPAGGRFSPVVGIDFGTTNSAIGLFEGEDVRLIPNAEGALTTPSLVDTAETGDILVGTPAKRQAITNPDCTIRSAKLKLGTDWSITRGTVHLTAQAVAEHILRQLREDAEAYVGSPLYGAVLTVPANSTWPSARHLWRPPTGPGSARCGSSTSRPRQPSPTALIGTRTQPSSSTTSAAAHLTSRSSRSETVWSR